MTGWVSLNSRIQFIICEGGLSFLYGICFLKSRGLLWGLGSSSGFFVWELNMQRFSLGIWLRIYGLGSSVCPESRGFKG